MAAVESTSLLLPFDSDTLIKRLNALNLSLTTNIGKMKELVTDYQSTVSLQNNAGVKDSAEKLEKAVDVYENVMRSNVKLIESLQKFVSTSQDSNKSGAPVEFEATIPTRPPRYVAPITTDAASTNSTPAATPSITPTASATPAKVSVADRKKMFENDNKQPITPPIGPITPSNRQRGGSSGGSFSSPTGSFHAVSASAALAAAAESSTSEPDDKETTTGAKQSIQDRMRSLEQSKNADKAKVANSKQNKSAALASELSGVNVKEAASTTLPILPGQRLSFTRPTIELEPVLEASDPAEEESAQAELPNNPRQVAADEEEGSPPKADSTTSISVLLTMNGFNVACLLIIVGM
jgi:hypothetical protein